MRRPTLRQFSYIMASVLVIASVIGFTGLTIYSHLNTAHGAPSGLRPIVMPGQVQHAVSAPLRSLPPASRTAAPHHVVPVHHLPALRQGKANGLQARVQGPVSGGPKLPSLSQNFDGAGFSSTNSTGPGATYAVDSVPPDPNGAVGPSDYVEIDNSAVTIFDKSGTVLLAPTNTNVLFGPLGNLCATTDDGDGTVVYDGIANRWVISQFAVRGADGSNANPYLQCVGVSTGADPLGSFNIYSFPYSLFPDYPKLGIWPDAYYTSFNFFNNSGGFVEGGVCAYNRARMLSGLSTTQQCFFDPNNGGLLPSSLDGPRLPPAGSPNYIMTLLDTSDLGIYKFHVDWVTPSHSTVTGPAPIPVASFTPGCDAFALGGGTCVPQTGTSQQLDSLGDRPMFRLSYRNFGSYESILLTHTVDASTTPPNGQTGIRWYEIRSPGTAPTVYQSGTYSPDTSLYRWMPSIAQDQNGDMALGFSVSSSTTHPGISITGRLVGDTLGTMPQGETSLIVGGGSQIDDGSGLAGLRWGDYTDMTVDPSDDCTFWYTNEYIPTTGVFNWNTRIGSFKFPGCHSDFTINAVPGALTIQQGSSAQASIALSAAGDPANVTLSTPGAPTGISATFNPNPQSSDLAAVATVNVAATVPAGGSPYTLTVSGTDGTNTHTTSIAVTVTTPPGANNWYFAEGYTGGDATEYLTIANPSTTSTAHVTATYLLDTGGPITKIYDVAPASRFTQVVNKEVPANRDVSTVLSSDIPVIAERPYYVTYTGTFGSLPSGTDVLGATLQTNQFDFANVDSSPGRDTWLTILNNNGIAMNVTINYFPVGGGTPTTIMHMVPANSRGTVAVQYEKGLPRADYSATVSLDQPGVVERTLYEKTDPVSGYPGAADVIGVSEPHTQWDFAEGYSSPTVNERYVLSNPSTTQTAHATVTFYLADGSAHPAPAVTLVPGQQRTVLAATTIGTGGVNNSAIVTSDNPVLAERMMSSIYVGSAGCCGAVIHAPGLSEVLGAPSTAHVFTFAEGFTGGQVAEYLTILNPDASNAATVTVTFLPADGSAPTLKYYTIGAHSRFTLYTNSILKGVFFSLEVESNIPVLAERPMSFIYNGFAPGSTDIIGFESN